MDILIGIAIVVGFFIGIVVLVAVLGQPDLRDDTRERDLHRPNDQNPWMP